MIAAVAAVGMMLLTAEVMGAVVCCREQRDGLGTVVVVSSMTCVNIWGLLPKRASVDEKEQILRAMRRNDESNEENDAMRLNWCCSATSYCNLKTYCDEYRAFGI